MKKREIKMLATALFSIEKNFKKYKFPLVEECLIKFWSFQTLESYTTAEKNHLVHLTQSCRREWGTGRKSNKLREYGWEYSRMEET